ncbi:hypothetical protein STEG23_023145 [Scotinomys teguina]
MLRGLPGNPTSSLPGGLASSPCCLALDSSSSFPCPTFLAIIKSIHSVTTLIKPVYHLYIGELLKSKGINDFKVKPVTLNLMKENVGGSLELIGTGDHFLNMTPVSQTLRTTINKWDLLKPRSFCKAKDRGNKTKQQPTELEKIFTNPTLTEY